MEGSAALCSRGRPDVEMREIARLVIEVGSIIGQQQLRKLDSSLRMRSWLVDCDTGHLITAGEAGIWIRHWSRSRLCPPVRWQQLSYG